MRIRLASQDRSNQLGNFSAKKSEEERDRGDELSVRNYAELSLELFKVAFSCLNLTAQLSERYLNLGGPGDYVRGMQHDLSVGVFSTPTLHPQSGDIAFHSVSERKSWLAISDIKGSVPRARTRFFNFIACARVWRSDASDTYLPGQARYEPPFHGCRQRDRLRRVTLVLTY